MGDHVRRMPVADPQRKPATSGAMVVGAARDRSERAADAIAERATGVRLPDQAVRFDPLAGVAVPEQIGTRIRRMSGGGAEPDAAVRRSVEATVGHELGPVRVHIGAEADDLSRSLQATAFTTGRDIFFRSGEYRPSAASGRGLLAHELAHVAQQGGRIQRNTVQRKLDGTRAALIAQGGKASRTSRITRGSYAKILSQLADYEKQERTVVAKQRLDVKTQRSMLAALTALEKLIERWFKDRQPISARDAKQRVLGADDDADAFDQNATETRSHALIMLRPRLAEEKRELVRLDYLKRRAFNDAGVTAKQDDRFGGGVNRLDYLEHGADKGVFMQDRGWETSGTAGKDLGIPEADANSGARSVAMSRLAELFGSDTIAQTDFATHTSDTNKKGSKLPRAMTKMGVRQAMAPGREAADTPTILSEKDRRSAGDISLSDPKLQQSLNVIQIIDAIAGQLDRHWHNYYISTNKGAVTGVVGIDLDMAFAVDHTTVDPTPVDTKGRPVTNSNFVGMPKLADAAFRAAVLSVTPAQVAATLRGLITDAELASTLKRFGLVQDTLRDIDPKNVVRAWNDGTAAQQTDDTTSYIGKMRAGIIAQQFEKPGTATLKSCLTTLSFHDVDTVTHLVIDLTLLPKVDAGTLSPLEALAVVESLITFLSTNPRWLAILKVFNANLAVGKRRADEMAPKSKEVRDAWNVKREEIAAAKSSASTTAEALAQLVQQQDALAREGERINEERNKAASPDWLPGYVTKRDRLIVLALEQAINALAGTSTADRKPAPMSIR